MHLIAKNSHLERSNEMILVNLRQTWPKVVAGEADAAEITLGAWAQLSDKDLETHADAILGIYKNEVVTAFDIEGWSRDEGSGRVTFMGKPSQEWGHLVGTPNPGKPWVQGMSRPVQVFPTAVLTGGNVPVEETAKGLRAVLDGFVLTVENNLATLQVPQGGKVLVSMVSA